MASVDFEVSVDVVRVGHVWQPIETAPHGEAVLLYCPYLCVSNEDRIEIGRASTGERFGPYSTISHHSWATHWMPLPEPPK